MKVLIPDRKEISENTYPIIIVLGDKLVRCRIDSDSVGYYPNPGSYVGLERILKKLFEDNIEDKYIWQEEALGYTYSRGGFPSCRTKEDVIRFIDYIMYKKDLIKYEKRRHSAGSSE